MNKLIIDTIIKLVATLAFYTAQAQGTITYLSNLGQTAAGSLAVGSNSWYATYFITGTNASGYSLDSIQLEMANASGNPANFTVMVYSAVFGAALLPGTNLCTLDVSLNPTTAGVYTFADVSNLVLSPGSAYFLVLTAGTMVADGAYGWSHVDTYAYSQTGGWRAFADILSSNNGMSWNLSRSSDSQFAISAIPIPEPSVLGLFSLGGLAFLWHRQNWRWRAFANSFIVALRKHE